MIRYSLQLESVYSDSDSEEERLPGPSSKNIDIIGRSTTAYISENEEDDRIPDEANLHDTILSDQTTSSPTLDAQSNATGTNHRLTIMSLCNPNNEDPYTDQPYTSELISQNLEPVQVPSWVRACNCKP